MIALSVIVFRDKAYVPTSVRMKSGPYLSVSPVYEVPLQADKLADALHQVSESGNPTIPDINYSEYEQSDPILAATGAKSWKQLAKYGASYGVDVYESHIQLYCSKLDKRGRFVHDPARTQKLSWDQSFMQLAEVILDDWTTLSS